MESVVPKVPASSIAVHLQKASEENAEKRKDDHRSSSERSITAPGHLGPKIQSNYLRK